MDFRTVNGLEVVFHGDDGVAVFAPFRLTLGGFLQVSMVAGIIISHKHEGGGAILLVAQTVVVQGGIGLHILVELGEEG